MPDIPSEGYKDYGLVEASESLRSLVSDTGLSIVYTPEEGPPLLDIVFIHGFQGHPFKTWACTNILKGAPSPSRPSLDASHYAKKGHDNISRQMLVEASTTYSGNSWSIESIYVEPSVKNIINHPKTVFWPRDLAPRDCPRARILVYGYDANISKYMTSSKTKNHGEDFLYALERERMHDRPLVFLAHSLGGIVVKEALAESSASIDVGLNNVVESTAAVIFLGTPHRGSPEFADLGELARTMLSALRVETNPAILNTLGLKTSDLERAQESFSRLWHKHDFQVKTFQESLSLTGIRLRPLGHKVVPDVSSQLGDPRERAETIHANHLDMCRFTGKVDPNYHKVAGELRSIYQYIQRANEKKIQQYGLIQRDPLTQRLGPSTKGDSERCEDKSRDAARAFLQNLKFPGEEQRYQSIVKPAEKTCSWLLQHDKYQDWLKGRYPDPHEGLLLLRGKPGAGKSVLMKEAHRQILIDQAESDCIIARFFFNAQGQDLEHSFIGMFRSLLYQILPTCQEDLDRFGTLWSDEEMPLLKDLQEFFESLYSKPRERQTFIFIDALDECNHQDVRITASFWRHITRKANASGAQLKVIMSIRDFPHIALSNCPEIRVDHCNQHDIAKYIAQRTSLVAITERELVPLQSQLVARSKGVFLWAILMLEKMIEMWHEGKNPATVLSFQARPSTELNALYTAILMPIDAELKQVTVRLFQWASFAVVPLRLFEWHHIMAFIRRPKFTSLHNWRMSKYFTGSDDQLGKLIKSLSRGLLEVRTMSTALNKRQGIMFTRAGAGSLDSSQGETRVVEFIHQSVREYFLQGRGFSTLDPNLEANPTAAGHLQIMKTCLDYINIEELEALVEARREQFHNDDPNEDQSAESPFDQDIPQETSVTEWDHATDELDQHSLQADRHLLEGHDLLQSLNALSSSPFGIDIDQWVATTTSQLPIRQQPAISSKYGSLDRPLRAPTQILQDYPALLSYATHKLFDHAKQAQSSNANPEPIVGQLQKNDNDTWNRWLHLTEAGLPFPELRDFVKRENLDTWLPYITEGMGRKLQDHLHRNIEQSKLKKSKPEDDGTLPIQISNLSKQKLDGRGPKIRARRYSSSVESFGSASSHNSRDILIGLGTSSSRGVTYLTRNQKRVEGPEERGKRENKKLEELMYDLIDSNSEQTRDSDSDRNLSEQSFAQERAPTDTSDLHGQPLGADTGGIAGSGNEEQSEIISPPTLAPTEVPDISEQSLGGDIGFRLLWCCLLILIECINLVVRALLVLIGLSLIAGSASKRLAATVFQKFRLVGPSFLMPPFTTRLLHWLWENSPLNARNNHAWHLVDVPNERRYDVPIRFKLEIFNAADDTTCWYDRVRLHIESYLGQRIQWAPLPSVCDRSSHAGKLSWEFAGRRMWIYLDQDQVEAYEPRAHATGAPVLPGPNTRTTLSSSKSFIDSIRAYGARIFYQIERSVRRKALVASNSIEMRPGLVDEPGKEFYLSSDQKWTNFRKTRLLTIPLSRKLVDDRELFLHLKKSLAHGSWAARLLSWTSYSTVYLTKASIIFTFLFDDSDLVSTLASLEKENPQEICQGYEFDRFEGIPDFKMHMQIVSEFILHGLDDPDRFRGSRTVINGVPKLKSPPGLVKRQFKNGWGFHATLGLCLTKMLIWVLLILAVGFAFIPMWLALINSTDLQNALAPGTFLATLIAIALAISAFP